MILAAGLGSRLRPLTNTLPKPLIPVLGKPLIVYHLENLARAGFKEIVINVCYLGNKIQSFIGNGSAWNLTIEYSVEPQDEPLETGGGLVKALPLLQNEPFITVNADIFTDFDFSHFHSFSAQENILAHLVLIPSTPKNDFNWDNTTGLLSNPSGVSSQGLTVSGITWYHPNFFKDLTPGRYSITPYWRKYADERKLSGEIFTGNWSDVGTIEVLQALNSESR